MDKICGIYMIRNLVNEKVYIGSSSDYNKRKYSHILSLKKGTHHSIYLQRAWNKYGETNFEFILLCCVLDSEKIISIEQDFLDEFKPFTREFGYNVAHNANCSAMTLEVRAKMSISRTGKISPQRGKKMKEEVRQLVIASIGCKIICINNNTSFDCIADASKTLEIKRHQIEYSLQSHGRPAKKGLIFFRKDVYIKNQYDKLSDNDRYNIVDYFKKQYTYKVSEKHRQFLAKKQSKRVICLNDENVYASIGEAAEYYKLGRLTIRTSIEKSMPCLRKLVFEFYVEGSENGIKERLAESLRKYNEFSFGRPTSKKVRCINTNKEYPSIYEAYLDTGIGIKTIRKSIRGGKLRDTELIFELVEK